MCTIPAGTIFFSFFLKTFFLPAFAGAAFAMILLSLSAEDYLPGSRSGRRIRSGLLIGDCPLAWPLSRPGIGMCSLASNGQIAPMPQAAIRADFDEHPDAQSNLFSQITLDIAFILDNLADAGHFVVRQISHFLVWVHFRPMEDRE